MTSASTTAKSTSAIAEGHGDAALFLLKAGAESDENDIDGNLAISLAPDDKVGDPVLIFSTSSF